ncbi:ribonuclease-III-like-domain-containing protein [Annulohypoxylon maeteangense]|uniref:ribonuclease-III-like-domain-containing protein n=1 Tax=Annulohypoxylon maeteangense TaxID=1927788 RepID=UPI002007BC3B|nr:ribonuclease-III-like-domain-containing protein [Annulohypoxylon maeteangense]KAI0884283.1 ribonuclease-III-like-domain-containing protein [Annulohypoxylon maeteangense]
MALTTSRAAARLTRQAVRTSRCQSVAPSYRPASSSFSTSAPRSSELDERPRWSFTPERMRAPFSPHITKDPARSVWKVNEDPQKLDDVLNNILGRDGQRMLPEELKWLAVTHKSFDQGRRGFNDRLAFLGRQICVLECTQSIISSPRSLDNYPDTFADRRKPFEDPIVGGVDNLSSRQPSDMLSPEKLAQLALDTGLTTVVRWKPRMPENIKGSGFDPIMSAAVYALIGAVSLQQGGKMASRIVRERILKKLRL